MHVQDGEKLKDADGLAVELGTYSGEPAEVFGPGDRVPNYTLLPPENLNIASGSYTVGQRAQLSELLISDMGICHWAACREFRVR
ncbi:hypothetical protein V5P93_003760 [Actinokineospora auranticolor]|uniref:Putative adhesin Stv domain-containing protein n=1 Tax=Actinokineospora auranticolor TaxID=155976 RepID=A0A2S6GLF1_9PSEU|nr:hypothetical protein [Actinokineospora auranticolor]PPK66045.1 hypothetical protein CLV40_1119 [Actinokineospora auranticolor]